MKNQVLSVEQMKHLQKLGVDTSKAKMSWYAIYETLPNWYNELNIRDDVFDKNYPSVPTFTLQDILEMIPKTILFKEEVYHFEMLKGNERYTIGYSRVNDDNDLESYIVITESNILTCAYETLCWLVRNKYIGGEK